MKIDPHAWLLTCPMTIGLVQLYFQPADHLLKRLLREVSQFEAGVWERFGVNGSFGGCEALRMVRRATLVAMVAGLAIASIASFAAFMGFAPTV